MPHKHPTRPGDQNPSLPAPDAVDLVLVGVSGTPGELAPFQDILSPEELARADRYRFPQGRERFILTRAHLKLRLGQYLGIAPGAVQFETNPHGKPRLLGEPEDRGLVFNVSHSGELALLAFARDTPLGVDIEAPRPIQKLKDLAQTCLTPEELRRWEAIPGDRQLAEFLRLWTCKEAFFKATGRGIALGLQAVAVAEDFAGFRQVPDEYAPADQWRLQAWQEGEYPAALAYFGAQRSLTRQPAASRHTPATTG